MTSPSFLGPLRSRCPLLYLSGYLLQEPEAKPEKAETEKMEKAETAVAPTEVGRNTSKARERETERESFP